MSFVPVDDTNTGPTIEALTKQYYEAIDARDWDTIDAMGRVYIVEKYESKIDNHITATNYDQYMETLRVYLLADPDTRQRILDVSAQVHPQIGRAEVFLTLEITGRPLNVKRTSVHITEWERRKEKGDVRWLCFRCTMLRGMDLSGGTVDEESQ